MSLRKFKKKKKKQNKTEVLSTGHFASNSHVPGPPLEMSNRKTPELVMSQVQATVRGSGLTFRDQR